MPTKEELRQQIKRIQQDPLLQTKFIAWSLAISQQLEKLAVFQQAETILFFASKKTEVDLAPLAQKYIAAKKILFPRVNGSQLDLHQVQKWTDLSPGFAGILEPSASLPLVDPRIIDLVLVPALAVDHHQNRLGQGGGFYDRLLAQTAAFKICPVFNFQMLDFLPTADYDQKVDLIITEK